METKQNIMLLHEQKRIGDYLIKTFYDESPESPRNWDNLGTMVCFHPSYNLGDKHSFDKHLYSSWEEMEKDIIDTENVHTILPLYLYDHSGITISTSPFSCRWDTTRLGWIFVSKEEVKKQGVDETKVEECLKGEVETYDQYIRGDVFGYKIYKVLTCDLGHEHEEELECSWGYYGDKECLSEAEGMVGYYMSMNEIVDKV